MSWEENHPEAKPIYRKDVALALTTPRQTQPYFTKYEYTNILAVRAQQISDGSRPFVATTGIKNDQWFAFSVAKRELEERKLPYISVRRMANGVTEYWNAQELSISW
jgi:DNA-directed RNA polymerase subunit K/omega